MNLNIRSMEEGDVQIVADLLMQLTAVASTTTQITGDQVRTAYARTEKQDKYLNLVAEGDGKVVGFISAAYYQTFFHHGETAIINELVVDLSARGKGVGRALIAAVVQDAHRRGAAEVQVGTEKANTKARRFYDLCGFDQEYVLLEMDLE